MNTSPEDRKIEYLLKLRSTTDDMTQFYQVCSIGINALEELRHLKLYQDGKPQKRWYKLNLCTWLRKLWR